MGNREWYEIGIAAQQHWKWKMDIEVGGNADAPMTDA